ncbi:P-type DNA transfer protein VirB5 [Plesiomonas shigelloides]|uniref:P-type DNA transfer protein VirB5 n=1 Tax=Plesiomonas shigelloides TaxID=703 RepID=UPI0012617EEE|nr:P-type DNA transfer protein VirB5 [Plesiomonas shigelloides]KAB7714816.1 P-type DNA transfer protein VirB5 [Plesiomonas shigelloides]
MKKSLLGCLLAASLLAPMAHAGIPVTVVADVPGQQAQLQNYAQMLKEYATLLDQLEQMRRQFEQMEKDYQSITGTRNLGQILNNPEFKQYLPDNWQQVYSSIRNNGYNGLTGAAKALRDASKIFDACANIKDHKERKICEAASVKPAQDQAFALDTFKKSAQRTQQIEGLMAQINRTTDPKSIAELTARIQAEQAMLQNEQTKMDMYLASSKAEQDLLKQQTRETIAKYRNSKNYGTKVPTMTFN